MGKLQGSWNTRVAGMRKLGHHPQKKSLAPFEPAATRPGADTRKSTTKVVQTFVKPAARKVSRHEVRTYDQRPRVGAVYPRHSKPARFASRQPLQGTAPLLSSTGVSMGECQVLEVLREARGGARADVRYRVAQDGKVIGLARKTGTAMKLIGRRTHVLPR